MMTRQLLWKDGMTIRPLLLAVLLGIFAIHALLWLATAMLGRGDALNLFGVFWILMPNLVALGAPAMLVGGEEENGTLGWLRTLPVSWTKLADSKFLVALAALVITWVVASSLMFPTLFDFSLTIDSVGEGNILRSAHNSEFLNEILRPSGIAYLLFFSLLLLLCGFVSAYTFRSPVAGLIAVIPLISLVNVLALEVGTFVLTGQFHYNGAIQAGASQYLGVGIAGFVLLVVLWAVQRSLAFRRLTLPETNRVQNLAIQESTSAYRPPAAVGTARPSLLRALIWQQFRQMGIPAVVFTLIVGCFIGIAFVDPSSEFIGFLHGIAPVMIIVGASWIGGLAFYGDNVRRRCAYFADRGISPTQVWWTRLSIPAVCFLLLGALFWLAWAIEGGNQSLVPILPVAWGFGHLIGQWMRRPVLTFFAAPACTAVVAAVLLALYAFYPNFYLTVLLTIPILLVATWRLTPRWLVGHVDFGYHLRVLGFAALAIAAPTAVIVMCRIATTPAAMPAWRAKMLAINTPDFASHPNHRLTRGQNIVPGTFALSGYCSPAFRRASNDEAIELLKKELASGQIGDFVSLDDVNGANRYAHPSDTEIRRLAVSVLLKWARQIRTGVLEGKHVMRDLQVAGEEAEAHAVDALENLVSTHGPTPELKKLVDSIPDRKLRHASRRTALIAQWKAYDRQSWRNVSGSTAFYGKIFMGHPIAGSLSALSFERTRADRYIDELTQLLLHQLDGELPAMDHSPGAVERRRLWAETMAPSDRWHRNPAEFCKHWTEDYQRRIDRLRAQFP